MNKLRRLASEAVLEIENAPETEVKWVRVRAFEKHLHHDITYRHGMAGANLETWRRIAASMGEKLDCDADTYFWLQGMCGQVALWMLPSQHQIDSTVLRRNILALCNVIRAIG
ncbi:hypothetical protein HYW59_04425 [Candidatus Kaiserbacteria bacterium]|nr:hypothetical protein [Candidatus Kaiserbacteria bacterium]